MAGPNVLDLMQRVVDLLVRMIGEEAARTRRSASWFAAGLLLLGVAVAFTAGALVETLAPLIPSRALRLLTVAVPLALAGRALLQRGVASAAANQADGERDDRQHQQHVNPGAQRIAADHSDQPQNH